MNEPSLVELFDRRDGLNLVIRVASQVLAQRDLCSGTKRPIWRVSYITRVDVIPRMPHAVAGEALPVDLNITLHMPKPPREHLRGDVLQYAVLNPVALATIGEALDPGASRRYWLELSGHLEWLRNMRAHCPFLLALVHLIQ